MSAQENSHPSGLSAEDLANLTPEELAAIEDGQEDASEQEALSRIAAAGDDEEDGDEDDGAAAALDEMAAKAAPAPAPAKAAPVVAEAPAADAGAVEPPEAQADKPRKAAPTYKADLPADIEQQQKDLSEKLGALRDEFKEGDVDVDDYEARRDALVAEREKLNRAITKNEIAQEMQQQSTQEQWQSAIDRAMDSAVLPEGGGIDYRNDAGKAADLDLFVRRLAEVDGNADKDMDWFLAEAHRRVKALHGIAAAPAQAAAVAAPAVRKSPVELAPKTLAQVPGADGPGDVSGEFSDMDALDGDDLEAAIARLNPAQRDKYERGR